MHDLAARYTANCNASGFAQGESGSPRIAARRYKPDADLAAEPAIGRAAIEKGAFFALSAAIGLVAIKFAEGSTNYEQGYSFIDHVLFASYGVSLPIFPCSRP